MSDTTVATMRDWIARTLDWREAHATFDDATANFPAELRGKRPDGLPHSAWELIEHMRITQRDILEFCLPAPYHEKQWPRDYWPTAPTPPSLEAWDASIEAYHDDVAALKRIALDPDIALTTVVPNGTTQTYLRELLLVADHNAHHLGQLILVRRALGAWG